MRWIAIANPAAGRPRRTVRLAEDLARRGLVERYEVGLAPGDSTRLTALAREFDGVVAIGGDGTIAAVVKGLDHSRQVLGVLPAGHGNCLARDLGVGSIPASMRAFQTERCVPIDLLRTRVHTSRRTSCEFWVASTLAVGYVAEVVANGRGSLGGLGSAAYLAASLWARPRPHSFTLTAPGLAHLPPRRTGVVINNTVHLANFRAFPGARLDDGRLDVMVQGYGWARQMVHNAAVLCGTTRLGPLLLHQAVSAIVDLDRPGLVMADGELIDEVTRIEVTCVPSALRCLASPA